MVTCSIRTIFRNPRRFLVLFLLKLFVVVSVKNGFPLTSWIFRREIDVNYVKNFTNYLEQTFPRCFTTNDVENRLVFFYLFDQNLIEFKNSDTVRCSLTSTSALNPSKEICIFVDDDTSWISTLKKLNLPNVKLIKILPQMMFLNTPLLDWYQYYSQLLGRKSSFDSEALMAIKIAYLWKYGGTVIENNVISIKPFPGSINNCLSLQDEKEICTSIIKFSKKHRILANVINELVKNYKMTGSNLVYRSMMDVVHNDTKVKPDDWFLATSDLFCPFQLPELKYLLESAEYDSFAQRVLNDSITIAVEYKDLQISSLKPRTFLSNLLQTVCSATLPRT